MYLVLQHTSRAFKHLLSIVNDELVLEEWLFCHYYRVEDALVLGSTFPVQGYCNDWLYDDVIQLQKLNTPEFHTPFSLSL